MPYRSHNRTRYRNHFNDTHDQNDGVEGVVYILQNEAFAKNWIKIGQSRYSGHKRAVDINIKASTGIPKRHVCVFECRTLDCGRAEKAVFAALIGERRGRQEYFEVDLDRAKSIIVRECARIDEETKVKRAQTEVKKHSNFESGLQNSQKENSTSKIDIICPKCKAELTVPPFEGQKKIRCPICKFVFPQASSPPFESPVATARVQRELVGIWPWVVGAISLISIGAILMNQSSEAELLKKGNSSAEILTESTARVNLSNHPQSITKVGTVPKKESLFKPDDLAERLQSKPAYVFRLEKGEIWLVSMLRSSDRHIRLLVRFSSKNKDDLMLEGTTERALDMLRPRFCGADGLFTTYGLTSLPVSLVVYENDVRVGEIPIPKSYC